MAYFAVQPVVYLVAWILLHVKGGAVALANIFAGRQPLFMPKWHRN
jgi:hypothetical protein